MLCSLLPRSRLTFTQHYCTRACALGPLVARQGPGAHKNRHVALKMLKMLRKYTTHRSFKVNYMKLICSLYNDFRIVNKNWSYYGHAKLEKNVDNSASVILETIHFRFML